MGGLPTVRWDFRSVEETRRETRAARILAYQVSSGQSSCFVHRLLVNTAVQIVFLQLMCCGQHLLSHLLSLNVLFFWVRCHIAEPLAR